MIVIIPSYIKGFYSYCLVPILIAQDFHAYIHKVQTNPILSVDFKLSAEEIGQILGGN